ncbi:TPA: tail fiber assembly protein [Citrobacter freundii]|uniref:tail fiber assembly protein n=1 Tax=Citrobacter freundii TaxID=546 RepID=UPI001A26D16C|nr:tail fiber assembly protein [Citrobacter freundii]MEA8863722.1 tail fiber assembly protein [Citrobacter freundii]HAU4302332.1 tail fiber assembly protein [Citrobacter freundii]HAU5691598.1 tail fiber assembly protein [Citrobacter freundii]HBM9354461.1 tail fiber assembly protein [Citrobacter freundii]HCD8288164.1 tail fiber assembly protein [Citrobacter freundii]
MNKYLYDAVTNAFYPIALQADYEAAGMWPENGVEVNEETFAEFQKPPLGKVRVAGDDGYPAWADIPPPTHEELISISDAEKQSRIDEANEHINSKQWPGKAAIGRLKGDALTQYGLWLDYLDALEAVDTSSAPNIEWPTSPEELAS